MSSSAETHLRRWGGPRGVMAGGSTARIATFMRQSAAGLVLRRLLIAIPLVLAVSAISFVLVSLTPGDAARSILGEQGTEQQYKELRHALRLDLPLYQQYWDWLKHAVTGDLGSSLVTGQQVTAAIDSRLPATLSLIIGALLVSLLIGVGLGVVSAIRGGVLGRLVDGLALVGFALPAFWVGAELIVLFAVKLQWLPASGYVPMTESVTGWLESIILPVFALSLWGIAAVAKQAREAMLEALASEYIRVAWANGLSPSSIYFRHALKNASLRVLTVLGVQVLGLLGGTVLVENVFAIPGLGSLVVSSSAEKDLPVVQGIALYFTIMVVAINLATDLAYSVLNPRVRAS
jgi:peptide/nickel transport system permease protein